MTAFDLPINSAKYSRAASRPNSRATARAAAANTRWLSGSLKSAGWTDFLSTSVNGRRTLRVGRGILPYVPACAGFNEFGDGRGLIVAHAHVTAVIVSTLSHTSDVL